MYFIKNLTPHITYMSKTHAIKFSKNSSNLSYVIVRICTWLSVDRKITLGYIMLIYSVFNITRKYNYNKTEQALRVTME